MMLITLICMHKTTGEVWVPYRLVILLQKTLFCMQKTQIRAGTYRAWVSSRCFARTKPQMRSGTHRDLKFWSKMRCLACKNHRWGLGHIETSISGANHAILHAHKDRLCLGLIETCFSCPKVALLHPKTTHEGWDPWRLVILMLLTLHCRHKTAGEI